MGDSQSASVQQFDVAGTQKLTLLVNQTCCDFYQPASRESWCDVWKSETTTGGRALKLCFRAYGCQKD